VTQACRSALLDRATAAVFGVEFTQRLDTACRDYIAADGARSFDQCIGLPLSPGKRRNLVRNHWLLIAQQELQATGDASTAASVHAQLMRFIERGSWQRWRDAGPPADAAALHIALWHVVKANDGEGLSCKHVEALLKKGPGNFRRPALPFVCALMGSANEEASDGASEFPDRHRGG
jgi:hypothetical protein